MFSSRKKVDSLDGRSRKVEAEIAKLERQIKKLSAKVERGQDHVPFQGQKTRVAAGAAGSQAAFEELGANKRLIETEDSQDPDVYNEMGVRKYDLPGFWRRLKNRLTGNDKANRQLVSYLAAGSIQGLRPLRYEKRVARNRALAFGAVLCLIILGILSLLQQ